MGIRGPLSLVLYCSDGETEAQAQASSFPLQGSVLSPVKKAKCPAANDTSLARADTGEAEVLLPGPLPLLPSSSPQEPRGHVTPP